MRSGSKTRSELVRAARSYIEANGANTLTLRVLGDEVGMHYTALYRHFRNKGDLLAEVLIDIGLELLSASARMKDPRKRIIALGTGMRRVQADHPELSDALAGWVGGESGAELQRMILQALRELDVPEDRVAMCYQAIESFTNGSAAYDYAGSPDHVRLRRDRHRLVGDPALDDATRNVPATERLTEDAFRWGLEALIDAAIGQVGS